MRFCLFRNGTLTAAASRRAAGSTAHQNAAFYHASRIVSAKKDAKQRPTAKAAAATEDAKQQPPPPKEQQVNVMRDLLSRFATESQKDPSLSAEQKQTNQAMIQKLMQDKAALEQMSRYMLQPVSPDEALSLGMDDVEGQRQEYEQYQRSMRENADGGDGGGRGTAADAVDDAAIDRLFAQLGDLPPKLQQAKQEKQAAATAAAAADAAASSELARQNGLRAFGYYRTIVRKLRQLGSDDGRAQQRALQHVRREFRSAAAQTRSKSQGSASQDDVENMFHLAERYIRMLDSEIGSRQAAQDAVASRGGSTRGGDTTTDNDDDEAGDSDDGDSSSPLFVHSRETLDATRMEQEGYWNHYYQQDAAVGEWYCEYDDVEAHLSPSSLLKRLPGDALVIGGGLSLVGAKLVQHAAGSVYDVDISGFSLKSMEKMYRSVPAIKFMKVDIRDSQHLTQIFGDEGERFSVAVDKATFDSILATETAEVDVQLYERNVWRLLRPGGSLLLVSTAPLDAIEDIFAESGRPWQVELAHREGILGETLSEQEQDDGAPAETDMAISFYRLTKPGSDENTGTKQE